MSQQPFDTKDIFNQEERFVTPPTSDERTLAILCHLLGYFLSFLVPLIIYLVKKDESPYVAAHAKEALNFQITLFLVVIGLFITIIGILLVWVVAIVAMVLAIVATVKAAENKLYRYPLTLRLIK
ncbi:MAG: DUF4870 domain-containing protein [Chitinophagaceae bacterium]|nr:DUF4870 domain-containing protein [Chitinophagaceae bacterium]